MENQDWEMNLDLGLSFRPPSPGEVWTFDALEAHAMFMGLNAIKQFMDEEDLAENLLFKAFAGVNDEYDLSQFRGEWPKGIKITPTTEDWGFFTAFVATLRWHLWCLPSETELPCGHNPANHEILLKGWFDREIGAAKEFSATRRAIESLPVHERIIGKQIIARSDLVRWVEEEVEKKLDGGLYSPDKVKERIFEFLEAGHSPEAAEKLVQRMRKSLSKQMGQDLLELYKNNMRVIEDF